MIEHLKNFGVGAVALAAALAAVACVIWIGANYGLIIIWIAAVSAISGAVYGLGWSIRQRKTP